MKERLKERKKAKIQKERKRNIHQGKKHRQNRTKKQ